MKNSDTIERKILLILKLDSQKLYERIKYRAPEYMQIFSAQRTRDHFADIFKTKYSDIKISELKYCGEEVLVALDHFYSKVDDLHWYLGQTQEMPASVEDYIFQRIKEIEILYETLQLHISADLNRKNFDHISRLEDNKADDE